MKCPYCGAELQENARFCLYCMESLQEKTQIPSLPARKRIRKTWLAILLAVVLTAAVIGVLVVGLQHDNTQDEDAASIMESSAVPTEKKDFFPINNCNDFYFDAISETERLAGQDLWKPSGLYLLNRTEQMEVYSAPVYVPDAAFNIYFFDEGVEIFAAVTNLTEDALADGLRLSDCITAATYYGMGAKVPSFEDIVLSDSVAAGDCYVEQLKIDDPAAQWMDEGTAASVKRTRLEPEVSTWLNIPQQYLVYELRTRTYKGSTYYDIFLFYGQE